MAEESDSTVLLAGAANLAIAIAKVVAGLLSGSTAIGLLLIVVAFTLGRDNKTMLIGRALPDDVQQQIRGIISGTPGIEGVLELLSLRLAPDQVLVVATVDLADMRTTGSAIEQLAERVDTDVRREFPMVRHLYLDPTPGDLAQS